MKSGRIAAVFSPFWHHLFVSKWARETATWDLPVEIADIDIPFQFRDLVIPK